MTAEKTPAQIWDAIEARLSGVQWSRGRSTGRPGETFARDVDAYAALNRNALAADAEPPRAAGLRRSMSIPRVTEDVRAEYEYELRELAGRYMDTDSALSPEAADSLALADLGCVEFYDWLLGLDKVLKPRTARVRCLAPRPELVGCCSRCESVGHVVESCPFGVGDADVMHVARLRRERRAQREVAA